MTELKFLLPLHFQWIEAITASRQKVKVYVISVVTVWVLSYSICIHK